MYTRQRHNQTSAVPPCGTSVDRARSNPLDSSSETSPTTQSSVLSPQSCFPPFALSAASAFKPSRRLSVPNPNPVNRVNPVQTFPQNRPISPDFPPFPFKFFKIFHPTFVSSQSFCSTLRPLPSVLSVPSAVSNSPHRPKKDVIHAPSGRTPRLQRLRPGDYPSDTRRTPVDQPTTTRSPTRPPRRPTPLRPSIPPHPRCSLRPSSASVLLLHASRLLTVSVRSRTFEKHSKPSAISKFPPLDTTKPSAISTVSFSNIKKPRHFQGWTHKIYSAPIFICRIRTLDDAYYERMTNHSPEEESAPNYL